MLAALMHRLRGPALFWLDAHYSGSGTAQGVEGTPIGGELATIFERGEPDVVLIDDAREFTGRRGYPTLAELEAYVQAQGTHRMHARHDVIRLTPTS